MRLSKHMHAWAGFSLTASLTVDSARLVSTWYVQRTIGWHMHLRWSPRLATPAVTGSSRRLHGATRALVRKPPDPSALPAAVWINEPEEDAIYRGGCSRGPARACPPRTPARPRGHRSALGRRRLDQRGEHNGRAALVRNTDEPPREPTGLVELGR